MRRFSLLLVVIALLAAACTNSTAVLGDPAAELARVDPDGALAEPTVDPLDNSWLETAPPLPTATPVPTPLPLPTLAPRPTPQPTEPSVRAEPDQSGSADSASAESEPQDVSFEGMVASSLAALHDSSVVEITVERSIGPGAQNDYSSVADIVVDRLAGFDRAQVLLDGAGWSGLSSRNELERLQTGDEYEILLSADELYLSASPDLSSLPEGKAWLQQPAAKLTDAQIAQFESIVVNNPRDVLTDVVELLSLDVEPREVGNSTFMLDVPNAEILRIAPGSSILSLVALDQVRNENLDASSFEQTSPVQLRFVDGLISAVDVDLSPVFAELPALGGTDAFTGIEISESFAVRFSGATVVATPERSEVADPTDFYPEREQAGTCHVSDAETGAMQAVSCDEPHGWEILAVGRYDDAFGVVVPTGPVFLERTLPLCNAAAEELLGISLDETGLIIDVQTPDASAWDAGDRQYACFVNFGEPVTGRVTDLDLGAFGGKVQRFDLQVGQCVRDEGLDRLHFTVVDCAEPHFYEAYLRFAVESDTGGYPGEEAVFEQADRRCVSFVEARVSRDDLQLEWQVQALLPSAQTWAEFNDTDVVCLATIEEPVTGIRFAGEPAANE